MEALRQKVSNIKRGQWIFAGILSILALGAWLSLSLIIHGVVSGIGIWVFSALALLAFSVGIALSFFLMAPPRLALGTYGVISIIALPFFGWRGIEIIAGVVIFITTYLGYTLVRREQEHLIPFWYSHFLRRGMPIFFTGLAFAIALFYSASPSGRISEGPQISQIANASPEFVSRLVKNYLTQIPTNEEEKNLAEFLTTLINTQLRATILSYKQFLPFIYVIGLFFVLRTLATPFMWASIGIGWVVMRLLLHFKLLAVRKVSVEKEEVIL